MRGSRPKGFGLFNTGEPQPQESVNLMPALEPEDIRRDWRGSPEVERAMRERKLEFVKKDGSRVEIGRGAFAKAFLARAKDTDKEFVVKEVDLSILKDDQRKKAGLEVTFLKSLNHENVIRCLDAFNTANILHIVLEYASGGTLHSKIDETKDSGNVFTVGQVRRWFAQLAAALRHLHGSRVLHRDLKTANVFLDSEERVKLGDFGLSRNAEDDENFSGQQVGTPYYFAPEVVKSKPFSNKTDVWSAGVIAYELAFLKKPFQAKSIRGLYKKIQVAEYLPIPDDADPHMTRLLTSILVVEPKERPSAATLCRDEVLSPYVTCDTPMKTPPRRPSASPMIDAIKPPKAKRKSNAVASFLQSVATMSPLQVPATPEDRNQVKKEEEDDDDEYGDDFEAEEAFIGSDFEYEDCEYDDDFESFDDEELTKMKELIAIH